MASIKEQKRLNRELFRECEGYTHRDIKPDGAYIQDGGCFFNINKIKRLIEAGADVNAKSYHKSPLHCTESVEVAKLLISAGADVNAKKKWGETPLYLAVEGYHIDLVKLFISAGADVNSEHSGGTLLHLSISKYRKGVAELLISAGAIVNTKDYRGYTPLAWAVWRRDLKIVKLLISTGATE